MTARGAAELSRHHHAANDRLAAQQTLLRTLRRPLGLGLLSAFARTIFLVGGPRNEAAANKTVHGPRVTVRLVIEGRMSVTVKVAVLDGAPELEPYTRTAVNACVPAWS